MALFKASAPGNLFFFGEHAAVYGRPAICAAVERRTYAEIAGRADAKIIVRSDSFGCGSAELSGNALENKQFKAPELSATFDFLEMILKPLEIKAGFELKICSDVPVNSGMSSSTALLASVLKAASMFAGKNIAPESYFKYIYPMQVKVHGGKASGSEIISSALGGFNRIQKVGDAGKTEAQAGCELTWKHLEARRFSIVVGNTKVSSPTSLTVGYHIPSVIARKKDFVFGAFDGIAKICAAAEKAIAKGDEIALGALMDKNQNVLSSLGLSHPKLDDCIEEAKKAGALGAKLSGSGWGGIMFALTREKDADNVIAAIKSTGADAFKTEVGGAGVREEY